MHTGDQHPRDPTEALPASSSAPSRLPARWLPTCAIADTAQQDRQELSGGWVSSRAEGVIQGSSSKPACSPGPKLHSLPGKRIPSSLGLGPCFQGRQQ